MEPLSIYLPVDRRQALARGVALPDRTHGTALFADISGFTPLTEALTRKFGPRRGVEELTRQLNSVYDSLIDEVDRYGGSVLSFSGDAITCWFDATTPDPARRAVACALAMQIAMQTFATISIVGGETVSLAMKAALASGPARRFLVGDPAIQRIDTLAGETLARMAEAEHLAHQGEVIADQPTVEALGDQAQILGWRTAAEGGERFAYVARLHTPLASLLPALPPSRLLPDEEARAWLQPRVYESLREGLGETLTELRPAVAVFLRFDGIDYDLDDEAGAKLDTYIRWVQNIVATYDGSLLQLTIGDKGSYLYIAFGAPAAHEDDARRALNAALELAATPPEASYVGGVQIGISQGVMRSGAYGGMTRRTYGVIGDDVNLAARLMQHAGRGEILVNGRVQAAAASLFNWEVLPPIRVKGKREPVPVARLLGQRQGRAEATRYSGAMVGREEELAQLAQFIAPIFAGRFAGVLSVYGEAGMGKSRLLYEARRQLEDQHLLKWLTFPAEGVLRQSLNPFQYGLREYFDQSTDASEDVNKARFEAGLDALIVELRGLTTEAARDRAEEAARELDRARSFLGALAGGLRWEGSLYEQVEPKLRLENTVTACKALIVAESLRQPLVLVIEDGHWLDADTAGLLKDLTRNVEAVPFVVLVTSRYRDDGTRYQVEVDEAVPQAAIDLNQLSPAGVQAMAAQVLQGEPDKALAAFLAEKTNGNPFFVEQLALDLRERGLIAATTGRAGETSLALTENARVEEVPVNITAVLVARLDRLAGQIKAVVQTAAVLGQEFEILVLSYMLREDTRLPVKVKQAEGEAIWSALNEMRYLFKHALLRDAAYDMQLQARLRELHALAGAAIEQLYADDLDRYATSLAYHWGQAGHAEKEGAYSAQAGEQALRISAFRDALRYFRRALELLPTEPTHENERRRAALSYQIGEALVGRGLLREAREHLETSLALARKQADQKGIAEALSYLGGIDLRLGEIAQAEAALREGLALARASGDQVNVAISLNRLGHIARGRGAYAEAAQLYADSLAAARAAGNQVRIADALNGLGLVDLFALKNMMEAQQRYQEAQAVFRAIGYRTGVVMTLGNLGLVATELGDYAEALRLYQEALALAVEIGDQRFRAALLDNVGDAAYLLNDLAQAEQAWLESLKVALDVGVIASALLTLAGIAKIRARQGRATQALEMLGLALHHPATDDEVRQRGLPLLTELQAALPTEVVEQALQRGGEQTLEALAVSVLSGH